MFQRSMSLALLSILAALLMARCTTTAKAAIGGHPDEAAMCAAKTLSSLGYYVEQRVDGEPLRAEREKHVRNPFNGNLDTDRITVLLSAGGAGHEGTMRVLGETVHSGAPGLARTTSRVETANAPARTWVSSEVRGDVQKVAAECGIGASPR